MARLTNETTNAEIAADLKVAASLLARMKGLLGESFLPEGTALWIRPCNSIHTWFMRFPIDVVFVDERLIVRKTFENLAPWRLTLPRPGLHSVFEMPAGTLKKRSITIGDQLNVGD
jgi:uncharacterized membrane protein (UPF0127 family)